jgi:hypothetical protein
LEKEDHKFKRRKNNFPEILSPVINKSKKSNIFGPNAFDFLVLFKREGIIAKS